MGFRDKTRQVNEQSTEHQMWNQFQILASNMIVQYSVFAEAVYEGLGKPDQELHNISYKDAKEDWNRFKVRAIGSDTMVIHQIVDLAYCLKTGLPSEYNDKTETVSPVVLEWLDKEHEETLDRIEKKTAQKELTREMPY